MHKNQPARLSDSCRRCVRVVSCKKGMSTSGATLSNRKLFRSKKTIIITGMATEKRNSISSAPSITGKTIYGHAAKFGVRSENLGTAEKPMYEIIEPGAFDGRLNDDVVCLWNHDNNHILARSNGGKGTLKLSIDSIGLRYEFVAPDTTLGRDLVESMKRGDIDGASFAFSVAKDGEKWKDENGVLIRRISKISRLFDVSVVLTGAYSAATSNVRSRQNQSEHPSITNARRRLSLIEKSPSIKIN